MSYCTVHATLFSLHCSSRKTPTDEGFQNHCHCTAPNGIDRYGRSENGGTYGNRTSCERRSTSGRQVGKTVRSVRTSSARVKGRQGPMRQYDALPSPRPLSGRSRREPLTAPSGFFTPISVFPVSQTASRHLRPDSLKQAERIRALPATPAEPVLYPSQLRRSGGPVRCRHFLQPAALPPGSEP